MPLEKVGKWPTMVTVNHKHSFGEGELQKAVELQSWSDAGGRVAGPFMAEDWREWLWREP